MTADSDPFDHEFTARVGPWPLSGASGASGASGDFTDFRRVAGKVSGFFTTGAQAFRP